MGYASRSGRAVTNPENPRAFGVCDRCGIWYNLHKLRYQWEWQGVALINLRHRVCNGCMDKPNPQLRVRMAPPDPAPVWDPRPESFIASRFSSTPQPGNFIAEEIPSPPPLSWPASAIETETGPPLEIEP
jgi:hypothetical protein